VIIFLFLRNIRSTLIICTSIPISVIGTFALLYFGGYTLNTMTFGGLALGIGMIVDAAIVVLENTYRHLEMGKDRMTAAIDGSEEVWSAILASTLTHISSQACRASCSASWPRWCRSRSRCRCSSR
jgi:HAE1 family hydrophobic/amphiphilic exporter-1